MAATEMPSNSNTPLSNLEEWEDFLKVRYPEETAASSKPFQATDPNKAKEQFRNYEADARPSVREFYRSEERRVGKQGRSRGARRRRKGGAIGHMARQTREYSGR